MFLWRAFNQPTNFAKKWTLEERTKAYGTRIRWCYVFFLERILVERVNSADPINLVMTCTADCTCHHLTKYIYFLSEMWNLKQIRNLAIANVARFASLNDVFLSWEKNTTTWLYVTLTGHITIRNILEKNESLGIESKHMVHVPMIFPLNYCFQADVMVFLLERILVERVNSAKQINCKMTCTTDFTCHHLTKNMKFFEQNVKFQTNWGVSNRKCCSIC